MKLGTVTLTKGAEYNVDDDRITISMSPAEVHNARNGFRKLAMKAESYTHQTECRRFKEFFDEVYRKWEEADHLRQRERDREKDDQRRKE